MTQGSNHYDERYIRLLELIWGKGYLSPGGIGEVKRVLEGIDLTGKSVLDIGCGAGGITASLVKDFGAASVTGIDVESTTCEAARRTVKEQQLQAVIDIVQVEPGPIPFEPESFDTVFSKDAIVHIADKQALAQEVFGLLKPGGWFVASDWLTNREGEPSDEMAHYLALEGLNFDMATPGAYANALERAGFTQISLSNRNAWYRDLAREELARLSGPQGTKFLKIISQQELDETIDIWKAMIVVLESGEHCPHHFRGQKPAESAEA